MSVHLHKVFHTTSPIRLTGLLGASALQTVTSTSYALSSEQLATDQPATSVGGAWEEFRHFADVALGESPSFNSIEPHRQLTPQTINSPESVIFNRLVELKVSTATTLMHLNQSWRSGLYQQLDNLIDAENWDFDDQLPTDASYMTFLRTMDVLGLPTRPGLAATSDGNIIATWTSGSNRLTIECQPNDNVRWIVVRELEDGLARAAVQCKSIQISCLLKPYRPEVWFDGE